MSVRTISDDEMREIFSIVDKDSGGTVSAMIDIYIRRGGSFASMEEEYLSFVLN